ncbi:MAG: efflux transporter outer membrane subunit [Burkholderiales bacterium]|nr:efflux transporter outer membrane subunit [Burkholderiales bacterium]
MTLLRPLTAHARLYWISTLAGALLLATGGCAAMHADAPAATQIDAQQVRLAEPIKLVRDGWPEAQWWKRYGDAQLDALIDQALKDSPTMAAAHARVAASRAQGNLVEASTGLFVGFEASLNRQELSHGGFLAPFAVNVPSEGLTGPWYTEGTLGLTAHYDVDLWGKDRARVDAAVGAHRARQAEAAQAELVLATRVAEVYYEIQSLYAALDVLKGARDIEADMVTAHTSRSERGLEARTPTEIARIHRLELDRQITATEGKIAVLRETMRALLGAGPDALGPIKPQPLPASAGQMPASLGYDLLARRPDLQAMRWYVEASERQIDAARDAFYPSFDIKAFFGMDAVHLEDVLRRSSRQINLIPGLSLPIFDSGRLNAQLAGARAQGNLTIAQYNQSVLDAVRDVAQLGIQLQSLDQQAQIQQASLDAATFAKDSAEAHFQRGLVDQVTAREAVLPVLRERGKMIELQSQQIEREIALTMALGGGYQAEQVKGDH